MFLYHIPKNILFPSFFYEVNVIFIFFSISERKRNDNELISFCNFFCCFWISFTFLAIFCNSYFSNIIFFKIIFLKFFFSPNFSFSNSEFWKSDIYFAFDLFLYRGLNFWNYFKASFSSKYPFISYNKNWNCNPDCMCYNVFFINWIFFLILIL